MSIGQIHPVGSTPPAQSALVNDSSTREVPDAEVNEFEKALQANPVNTVSSSGSMDDVKKMISQAVLNNAVTQAAAQREELKRVMEEQS